MQATLLNARPAADGGLPIETATRAEIDALQEGRLLEMVSYVYDRAPLVREVWQAAGITPADIRSIADFKAKAPFIDKDRIREFRDRTGDPFGGILCCDYRTLSQIGASSGTTGDPTLFACLGDPEFRPGIPGDSLDARMTRPSSKYWGMLEREYRDMGITPGSFVAVFQPRVRGQTHRMFAHQLGAIPIVFDHHPKELPRFIELSLQYRPKALYILSTPLIIGLAQIEKETQVDLRDVFSSYEGVIFGGEPLGERARALVERWGIKPFDHSSLGDADLLFECGQHDGSHAWEDRVLVEVIDPETELPVPDGWRGELVVTSLEDFADPLLRFRSGDIVRWTGERCRCGRTHKRLWPLGRLGDEILVQGRSVLPRDIWVAIEQVEETSAALFQIIRPERAMEELTLRVGYAGSPDLGELAQRLADRVEALVGCRPRLHLVPNEELLRQGPPHKIPRVAKK